MDEVVTCAEVLRWLPKGIGDAIELSLAPEVRGWWTAEEAAGCDGSLIEVRRLSDPESRYIRYG